MKLTRNNDTISIDHAELAEAVGEYIQRKHEKLTSVPFGTLVMTEEDVRVPSRRKVPLLRLKGSLRDGSIRVDEVVVELNRDAEVLDGCKPANPKLPPAVPDICNPAIQSDRSEKVMRSNLAAAEEEDRLAFSAKEVRGLLFSIDNLRWRINRLEHLKEPLFKINGTPWTIREILIWVLSRQAYARKTAGSPREQETYECFFQISSVVKGEGDTSLAAVLNAIEREERK